MQYILLERKGGVEEGIGKSGGEGKEKGIKKEEEGLGEGRRTKSRRERRCKRRIA